MKSVAVVSVNRLSHREVVWSLCMRDHGWDEVLWWGRPGYSQGAQAAGHSSRVLQGRSKRKPFGNWMRVWNWMKIWAAVAETSIPWTGTLQRGPGWCPAVIQDVPAAAAGMSGWGGAARKELAWHSWGSSSGSSPALLLSCGMFCWNMLYVELPWGGSLGGSHVCTLLSALVRNFQAGLSVGMPAA